MLTYDDLENMRAGKEAKIQSRSSEIAAQKLEEVANIEEQQTQQIEQQSADADAERIIAELHRNPDLDPNEVMGSLPPVLQEAVMRKIHEGAVPPPDDEPEIDYNPEEEAMESDAGSEMPDEPEIDDNPEEEAMENGKLPRKL